MRPPMHRIKYYANDRRIDIRIAGFWQKNDVDLFTAELATMISRHHRAEHPIALLTDARSFDIQSQIVVARYQQATAAGTTIFDGPNAVVIIGALKKTQMRRATRSTNAQLFDNIAIARQWLREQIQA